ncbi:MAG: M3 family oligoendopeptidase [Armatimonadota bacterium]
MSTATTLPSWNTSTVFSSIEGDDFRAAREDWAARVEALEGMLDASWGKDDPTALASFLQALNEALEAGRTIGAYIQCFVSTDSRNEAALAAHSEMQPWMARMRKLNARLVSWVGSVNLEAAMENAPALVEHEFVLRRMAKEAQHQMSMPEEALAADLDITGGSAWSRLRDNLTSQLGVTVKFPDRVERMTMTQARNLAHRRDRGERKAGYEAELETWQEHETVFAAAMNSIKGQVLALCRRRGWNSPLDETLFYNNMDRESLDAMLTAARESLPTLRRYLHAKARAIGLERLAWFDLFAPVGAEDAWEYDRAQQLVRERFSQFSEKMGALASRAFQENWIDVPPKDGKRDGAFCMGLRDDESRILLNYEPTFNWVGTLAHELGHAYHNLCLSRRTPLQRMTPMTLAETASIFCEQIVRRSVLEDASDEVALAILEDALRAANQTVVDILSRFQFESRCFEGREARELSASEMRAIMVEAQRDTYGEGLDDSSLHPYMWAAKPHYYSSSRSFYNFPYMFGLLFGLGLFAQYQRSPQAFLEVYDDLLSSTGMADAASLAARFDIDIRAPDFWRSSLNVIAQDVERYESLVASL